MNNEIMSQEKIVEELNEVLQIDIDAVGAYQTAIASCQSVEVKNQLQQFLRDHERHILELEGYVRRSGGEPKKSADFKGLLRKGMTRMAGVVGTEACLRAMASNERAARDVYARHCAKSFPADILELLLRNYDDEQRHSDWIDSALRNRVWEHAQHSPL